MKIEYITIRVDSLTKDKLSFKAVECGITVSELIRLILQSDRVLSYDYSEIIKLSLSIDVEVKYNETIKTRLTPDQKKYFTEKALLLDLTLSQLIRLIIMHDNTIVANRDYLMMCQSKIKPVGQLVNKIAHQLNSEHLRATISEQSYLQVRSRFTVVNAMLSNLILLLKNSPELSELEGRVVIINKNDVLIWIGELSPICNNLNQISVRMNDDYAQNKITKASFLETNNRLIAAERNIEILINAVRIVSNERC